MSDFKDNFGDIRWSKKSHDAANQAREREDRERKEKEAYAKCGEIFRKRKEKLCRAKRTQKQVRTWFDDTMTEMSPHLKNCSEEGRKMVLMSLEDGKAMLIATGCGTVGIIKQHLPGDTESIPRTIQFRSQAELEVIPFVKRFSDQEGFVGFSANKMGLVAIYEAKNGISDTPLVGMVWCPKHITLKYPELAAFKAEIGKQPPETP